MGQVQYSHACTVGYHPTWCCLGRSEPDQETPQNDVLSQPMEPKLLPTSTGTYTPPSTDSLGHHLTPIYPPRDTDGRLVCPIPGLLWDEIPRINRRWYFELWGEEEEDRVSTPDHPLSNNRTATPTPGNSPRAPPSRGLSPPPILRRKARYGAFFAKEKPIP